MLTSTITILTTLTALAAALPSPNLAARAGGPAIVPIPSTCTVTNPLPTGSAFLPTDSAKNSLLYNAYYPAFSSNKTEMAEQCLQQCYGYGNHTECKAAFWAQNVKTPAGYYGTPGGDPMTACIMFDRAVTPEDFVAAPEGEGTDAYTRNLAC
ncbi:hypothetical protein BU26DRAFT_120422 [Trematosphaeria pertusa]|uniref:Apple domain-containing protein n=1 Tax=Trematosphaeria pertusa TaxID=390896 RepID=A0A6A6HXX8_9PLEO|nr:uncharacterized protein BU26DRAFT_120422 [Trematosphaeria pertusa]KAF2242877.1 hypothetical protein BU26DRAFT_120422 [Trematosphaeria pertusa]